ncbi:unnamed protein product [Ilex paraguariensis]|uniref:SCP domain-containing protein n=1 Tax=Ilex paraguariensis TaxID=185542 RepID=A0ABC8V467_9AQUA
MGMCKTSLALVCLLGLVMFHSSQAQNSPEDYLNAHNAARSQVGVGPLTWDNNVASYAENYANQRINDCNLIHSQGQYGENLATGTGTLSGTDAVNLWVSESVNYDYNSNSCTGEQCGHYTQVVKVLRKGLGRERRTLGSSMLGTSRTWPSQGHGPAGTSYGHGLGTSLLPRLSNHR